MHTKDKIDNLLLSGGNWNSYHSPAVLPETATKAKSWVSNFYRMINDFEVYWVEPAVSIGNEGEVALKWRGLNRKLTIYISVNSIEYMTSSDEQTTLPAEEGETKTLSDALSLYLWAFRLGDERC